MIVFHCFCFLARNRLANLYYYFAGQKLKRLKADEPAVSVQNQQTRKSQSELQSDLPKGLAVSFLPCLLLRAPAIVKNQTSNCLRSLRREPFHVNETKTRLLVCSDEAKILKSSWGELQKRLK